MAKKKTIKKTYTPHPGLVELAQRELFLLERRNKMKIVVRPPNFLERHRIGRKPQRHFAKKNPKENFRESEKK